MMNLPDSPNVIKVFACYEDEKYFYTLLESLQGGDLFDFWKILTSDSVTPEVVEREVKKIIGSLLRSLHHLHSQGLIHKDVKMENIMFMENGNLAMTTPKMVIAHDRGDPVSPIGMRLIDSDFLEEWEPSSPESEVVLGTDGYIAPEAYLGNACPQSDVFSAGVVMYLLIAGQFPFDDAIFETWPGNYGTRMNFENYVGSPKMVEMHAKLQRHKVKFGRPFQPYPEAMDLCKKMLEFDAQKRPDAAEALLHPWFRARDVKDVRDVPDVGVADTTGGDQLDKLPKPAKAGSKVGFPGLPDGFQTKWQTRWLEMGLEMGKEEPASPKGRTFRRQNARVLEDEDVPRQDGAPRAGLNFSCFGTASSPIPAMQAVVKEALNSEAL
jgi:serine/threonine protein kinase